MKYYTQPHTGNTTFKFYLNVESMERNFELEKMLNVLCCWGGMDKQETLNDGCQLLGWEFRNELKLAVEKICMHYRIKLSDPYEVWY